MNREDTAIELLELRRLANRIDGQILHLERTLELQSGHASDEFDLPFELGPFDDDKSGDWLGLRPDFGHEEWKSKLKAKV